MFEHPHIPYHPDMPPGGENHLSKERLVERCPGLKSNMNHVRRRQLVNLKEVPNPAAKDTQEKR